ncbi:MAG: UvrD-helicase domain-containing protein [Clostridia bacterium]|nr:UvrD-helicase domain-containing protein [Clostridia bacterium]
MADIRKLKNLINPKKNADKKFYLDLLDEGKQRAWEDEHIAAVLSMLKVLYLSKLGRKIKEAEDEKSALTNLPDYDAEKYRRVLELNAVISSCKQKRQTFKCFFDEPYFARMDLVDDKDGYNSYYIGKRGDEGLEIVDWRAPLARRYYQKSKLDFTINQFNYKLVLRRAIRTKSGRVEDFKNEYLSVGDNLSKEEIAGRDAAVIFDPFLKEILSSRKEKQEICDIIETIQEKQYEIITAPEDAEFIVQGVAGSGKTMILLHRLSYLLYNNEQLKPASVLVITPSDSFNAFIDELAQILELERVRTVTLESYYYRILKSFGIDLSDRVDGFAPVDGKYLKYVYSQNFVADVRKKLAKIYSGVRGMLPSDDGDEFVTAILHSIDEQQKEYEKIKNAGLRVRRCVLGEIKEKQDGGLFYTKRMRELFNCVSDVKEFLTVNRTDDRMEGYYYFYKQLLSFYKSLRFIRAHGRHICASAVDDLHNLRVTVEKEIEDLKRYKQRIGDRSEYTYPDRIEKREQTKKEIDATILLVENIASEFDIICDFAEVVRGEKYLVKIGKCESKVELARFFYREIVKPAKQRFGVASDKLVKSDAYAICRILCELGCKLTPAYSFVFVDEAQDIAPVEYDILRRVNASAKFNIFGDLKQNITNFRGIDDWAELGLPVSTLDLNYRNTNQIVYFVSQNLNVSMQAIGLGGEDVVTVSNRGIASFLADKQGLRAVITSEEKLYDYAKKTYNIVRESGKISKSKINLLTVYESKGLEFTAVAVADGDMTDNEKYIAYTRALKELALIR